MKKKNLIFYGLGGAGQRHLRILYRHYKKKINFFAYRRKKKVEAISQDFKLIGKSLSKKYKNLFFYKSYEESLIYKMDYAFICGPTSKNFSIIKDCLKKKRNIFVEKPFICSWRNFLLFKKKITKLNLKFLVGYQRRFHPQVIKLKKILDKNKFIKVKKKVFIKVNSYVPDWHKYENFKNLYACNKKLGGGALLTESHEIDLCLFFFGLPKKILCKKYFSKKIGIDVETSFSLKLIYDDLVIYFSVNMFSKNLKREINIFFGENKYKLDLLQNVLIKNNIKYFASEKSINKQFLNQLKYFFSKNYIFEESLKQIENNLKIFIACNKSISKKKIISLTTK